MIIADELPQDLQARLSELVKTVAVALLDISKLFGKLDQAAELSISKSFLREAGFDLAAISMLDKLKRSVDMAFEDKDLSASTYAAQHEAEFQQLASQLSGQGDLGEVRAVMLGLFERAKNLELESLKAKRQALITSSKVDEFLMRH